MKRFSLLFILAGLAFIVIGGYRLIETKNAQRSSLVEAREIVGEQSKSLVPIDKNQSLARTKTENSRSFKPEDGDTVGILSIPRIDAALPIVEGTDPDDLVKGVGHYSDSAYPLQQDQILLSGHRDTVFRRMGELEIGDVFVLQLSYGNFTYEIDNTRIVDADDRTVIKSTAPNEILTVTTCYPFSFIGNAPKRYVLTAKPMR